MENNLTQKGVLAALSFVISYLYDAMGVLFIILCLTMALDYITGILNAHKQGRLNSKTGLWGIVKKVCYISLVVFGLLFDLAIRWSIKDTGIELPVSNLFGPLITAWLFGNEGISILENLTGIGVPVPKFLVTGLDKFKDMVDKKGDKNAN